MGELTYTLKSISDATAQIPLITQAIWKGLKAGAVVVTLGREGRTLSQNSKIWPMLTDLSKHIDWYGHTLTPDEWKQVTTASLMNQKTVPSIEGGFVVLGASTSKMKKAKFSELIELIYAFGSEHNVKWSEKALEVYEQYRQAA